MPSSSASTPQTGSQSLRVLAHPLRSRLLARLRVHGPGTATELAEALGTNSGATSYHLRILEESGRVRDTGTGTGRRRVWEAVALPARESAEPDADADETAAARWLEYDLVQYVAERTDRWIEQQDGWPTPWRTACGLDDHDVLVTTEQLSAMAEELAEVLQRYRRVGAGSPGARRVAVYTTVLPVDPAPRTA
ncbi:helix-turn-helix domain-containing protein [Allobranchiibius huperziae]|uniref:DNA-binding transcriptional ArsR family regulator n=1 Tax=Allobranchiibius huperziae TaxID=1874116 RepID=A0A853DNE6_9MICO|nr:helix-turn-helix domain-containing protein [Allobranchiibius huperziae]NYJ75665.1 DNA-binding transcriptional ArsR family regulator [Allobranchiibius huperziae]